MTHPDAPPLTEEQAAMECWYNAHLPAGEKIGFGRDKRGRYHAPAAALAWMAWQAARAWQPMPADLRPGDGGL